MFQVNAQSADFFHFGFGRIREALPSNALALRQSFIQSSFNQSRPKGNLEPREECAVWLLKWTLT
jgi:hypothetical protein